MTKRSTFITLLGLLAAFESNARVQHFTVAASDISKGFVTSRIALAAYAMPGVNIVNPTFTPITALPKGQSVPVAVAGPKLMLGMERKQPFALIQTAAYSRNAQGQLQQLSAFDADITEGPAPAVNNITAAKGTSISSPLASGSWYKISIPSRGVYKIDYSFFQSHFGLSGSISSSLIRVFGNGGAMLSENNAVPRPADLTENAIQVVDGGDGVFNTGDYVLFYAPGPMGWTADAANDRFLHYKNLYADNSCYFVTMDGGSGLRMASVSNTQTPNETVSSYNAYQVHEEDLFNPGKFGKSWLGEKYGSYTTQGLDGDYNFNIGSGVDSVRAHVTLADRSTADGSSFTVSYNGNSFISPYFTQVGVDEDSQPVQLAGQDARIPVAGNNTLSFHLKYAPAASDCNGFLDFIELNYHSPLVLNGDFISFRSLQSVGTAKVASYTLQNANSKTEVWDVTDPLSPVKMNGSLSGSTFSFIQDAATLHEFVAMTGNNYGTPAYMGMVENQNIHGHAAVDMIIVTPAEFTAAAQKLANYHTSHDGLRCMIVTTAQVYNEFSSGSQDITAIRDMARWFYKQAGTDATQMPRYMLLLGDASYDYKDRVAGNTNFVPTYESEESLDPSSSFAVDDYYAFLDDNENINNNGIANTLDMGVGRLPVKTAGEADAVVNKIIAYTSPSSFGPWKLRNTFVGDNEDGAGTHLQDAEDMCHTVDSDAHIYNDSKIYLDNLTFISTPGGYRCPDANKAINDNIFKGTFLINYNGHGNTLTLAHERILTGTDFNSWKNFNSLPFMVTATCDFARYDNPSEVSAGEQLALKSDGGAIALLTTTAAVYAFYNHPMNVNYLKAQFKQNADGSWPTFGDAYSSGKNITYSTTVIPEEILNYRRFVLLGDPALAPAFPKLFVHSDSINNVTSGEITDTFKALGTYRVSGHVSDAAGALLPAFNGRVFVTIYDKPRHISLITKETLVQRNYDVQDNIIYKGIATVNSGAFSFSFIAPKDMNYDYGAARISYYAENGVTDAAGYDTTRKAGGYSDSPFSDNDAPIVQPYINDSLFRDGGLTGTNTLLYVKLQDASGINVSGNGVGHDLIGVLDGNASSPYNLNDYYETAPNSYQTGYVHFPVTGLTDGHHSLLVRAWDVNNNSGEGNVNFEVANGKVVKVEQLINYPNPFTGVTHFFFEHNHPNEAMHVKLIISSTDGRLVKVFEQDFTPTGSHSNEIIWDGTDGSGARLGSGIYPYQLILSTKTGVEASAYQKLVIIR